MDWRFGVLLLWSALALVLILRPEWLAMMRGETREVLQSRPIRGWISYAAQTRLVGLVLLGMAVFAALGFLVAGRP